MSITQIFYDDTFNVKSLVPVFTSANGRTDIQTVPPSNAGTPYIGFRLPTGTKSVRVFICENNGGISTPATYYVYGSKSSSTVEATAWGAREPGILPVWYVPVGQSFEIPVEGLTWLFLAGATGGVSSKVGMLYLTV